MNEASAARARTDVVIGPAGLSYRPGGDSQVAPGSMVSAFGNPIMSPLSSQLVFAPLSVGVLAPWELGGVNVTVAGRAVPVIYTSPGRLAFYVPADLPLGPAEVIITSQDGYISTGVVTLAKNVSLIMTTADNGTGPAIALNAGNKTTGPFDLNTGDNFGNDKRTRVTFFATGISGSVINSDLTNDLVGGSAPGANFAESIVVEARTQDGHTVRLPVEFAGAQGVLPGMDQVTVVLTPNLKGAGTVQLNLIINGQASNSATIVVR